MILVIEFKVKCQLIGIKASNGKFIGIATNIVAAVKQTDETFSM